MTVDDEVVGAFTELLSVQSTMDAGYGAGNFIGGMIRARGSEFAPNIPALIEVYLKMYPFLAGPRKEWVSTRNDYLIFFTHPYLAFGWQIAWVISRAPESEIAAEFKPFLDSADNELKAAISDLLEDVSKYARVVDYPMFGGGSGPPDPIPRKAGEPRLDRISRRPRKKARKKSVKAEPGSEDSEHPARPDTGLKSPWGNKQRESSRPAHIDMGPMTPAMPAAAERPQRHTLVSVLYGTDRVRVSPDGARPRYEDERADALSFGVATVSIPDEHRKGRLERPRWYRMEFRENPDKHVVIMTLAELNQEQFVAEARKARERDASADEALMFVHGFNVDFEESIRRTAQFATDLEFAGIAIAYSWPSKGSVFGYAPDSNVSQSSMFRLAEFIALVRSRLGLKRVHVVAHSMGNRLLAPALNQHVLRLPPQPLAELDQAVFAAPDIDPKTFRGFAEVFADRFKRCTLYTSTHDLALNVSGWIYRTRRTGVAVPAALTYGVDGIDVSNVDDSMMGHSYFSDKRVLLQDLNTLLTTGVAPGERFGMTEVHQGDGRYWKFKA